MFGLDGIGAKELSDQLRNEILPALRWSLGISEDEQTAMLEKAAKATEVEASQKAREKKAAKEEKGGAPSTQAKARKPTTTRKPKTTAEQINFDPAAYREKPMFSTIINRNAKPAPRGEPNPKAPKLEIINNPEPVS